MSGRKETYVSMRESEARRLREQEAQLRTVQRDLPERLNQIRADTMAEVTRQSARMDQRWQQFQNTADKLRGDLATFERQSQRRLREGLAQARAEYTGLVGEERSERLKHEEQMRQEYSSLIEQERAERQQQINELQSRISNIENREETLQQMASAWLQDLRILQDDVAQLPHQRFSPGSMERINGLIEQASINLRNGASQAALGQAQTAYFNLVELRSEVLYKEQQFEAEYLRALEAVKSLIEEVRANRQAVIAGDEAATDEDEKKEIEVDVDFWSKGRLSQISERLREIESSLEKEKQTLSLDQVRQLEEEANDLRQRLPEAIEAARLTIINSQACYNVAEIVADVMEEQGYSVEDGTYEGEDQRGAYAIKMRNLGGDEFVTIITPSPDQELAYTTQMNFYDRSQDETMRQSFAQAVYEGLNEMGLQATPPRETLGIGEPNEETRDLEKFRQPKPQAQPVKAR
jgi:chromosome segregation ATPase